jgi:tetratricopeptide (TPR) repeat protein
MLLDRKRIRFWQRWIFGFMAVLMAMFLLVGYSGVLSSCNNAGNSGGQTAQDQIDKYNATLQANPEDPTALLGLANLYLKLGDPQQSDAATAQQNLQKSIEYYDRYLRLSNAALGENAKQKRITALQYQAVAYAQLNDAKGAAAVYSKLTDLDPKNPDFYFNAAVAERDAGQVAKALLDFATFLKLDPKSDRASLVREQMKQLEAQLKGGTNAPTPTPSVTK